jgi:type VI secretion system protein ImpK
MQNTNPTIPYVADTSDIYHLFTLFCSHVFEQQNYFTQYQMKSTQLLNSEKTEEKLQDESNKSTSPYDFTEMHKNLCIYIKSVLDSEKVSLSSKSSRDIIYAMTAITDEIFLNTEWIGKEFWELNMLETKFFGTQVAGEAIFQKISELLEANDPLLLENAEIYIRLLSLGFKGKFREQDDESIKIDTYRSKLFEFISKNRKSSIETTKHRIFQKEYACTMPTIYRKLLPDGALITYISMFFVFMFIVFSSFVWILETKDIRKLLFDVSCIALRE